LIDRLIIDLLIYLFIYWQSYLP